MYVEEVLGDRLSVVRTLSGFRFLFSQRKGFNLDVKSINPSPLGPQPRILAYSTVVVEKGVRPESLIWPLTNITADSPTIVTPPPPPPPPKKRILYLNVLCYKRQLRFFYLLQNQSPYK